jgi:hypothetical protein
METDPFWTLMAHCRRQGLTGDERDAWLRDALLRLPPAAIVHFQACLDTVISEAFTWSLWAAADRIFGGWCSDDGFCYFQNWMVGLGRPVFEAAVSDPDALAYAPEVLRLSGRPRDNWCDDAPQWPALQDLAPAVHGHLTAAPEDAFHTAVAALRAGDLRAPAPVTAPRGRRWSALDEPEAVRRLPRLSAMFPLPRE